MAMDKEDKDSFKREIMREHMRQQPFFKRSWMGQRGWIRPTVLALLEEKPMKGVEIMDRLEERSKGWWRPSPGSIYPLLDELTEEGLLKKRSDGRYETVQRKAEGREGEEMDGVITNIESNISYIEDIASSGKGMERYSKRIDGIISRLKKIK